MRQEIFVPLGPTVILLRLHCALNNLSGLGRHTREYQTLHRSTRVNLMQKVGDRSSYARGLINPTIKRSVSGKMPLDENDD
jgi:hypothetical protein